MKLEDDPEHALRSKNSRLCVAHIFLYRIHQHDKYRAVQPASPDRLHLIDIVVPEERPKFHRALRHPLVFAMSLIITRHNRLVIARKHEFDRGFCLLGKFASQHLPQRQCQTLNRILLPYVGQLK